MSSKSIWWDWSLKRYFSGGGRRILNLESLSWISFCEFMFQFFWVPFRFSFPFLLRFLCCCLCVLEVSIFVFLKFQFLRLRFCVSFWWCWFWLGLLLLFFRFLGWCCLKRFVANFFHKWWRFVAFFFPFPDFFTF
jgi:hypothetical protein